MFKSSLGYDFVIDKSSPIPDRALNGGLFTGEPFAKNAEYGNFPSEPTSAHQNHINLRSAKPPHLALYHMQVGYRPGNNTDAEIPGVVDKTFRSEYTPYTLKCIDTCDKYNDFVVKPHDGCFQPPQLNLDTR